MGGEFYIKVQRPKGREFSKSKWRKSHVNRKTGRTKYFQVKSGDTVIRNACLQKLKTKGRLTGIVFKDTNGNGQQDGFEPGVPNVGVNITDSSGNSQTIL